MSTWYLSFADASLPRGSQFLGAVVVEGVNLPGAVTRAHLLGVNPGGGVYGIELPAQIVARVPAEFMDRLLAPVDIREFDRAIGGNGTATRVEGPG